MNQMCLHSYLDARFMLQMSLLIFWVLTVHSQSSYFCRFKSCVSFCSCIFLSSIPLMTILYYALNKITTELRTVFQVNDTEVFNWKKFTVLELLRSGAWSMHIFLHRWESNKYLLPIIGIFKLSRGLVTTFLPLSNPFCGFMRDKRQNWNIWNKGKTGRKLSF